MAPSMLMVSPSLTVLSLAVAVRAAMSNCSSSHPTMHDLPMPRVTTAAWLVIPPRLVRTPWALMMP